MSQAISTETPSDSSGFNTIIEGNLWLAAWQMTWPLFLNTVLMALACLCDTWIAGRLGLNEQVAIGLGGQVWFLMILLAIALATGTNAIVSRYWGARELASAVTASHQSLLLSIVFGAGSALIGLLLCCPLLRFLGASHEVEALGWSYLQFALVAHLPMTILWTSHAIFRAQGKPKAPLYLMAATVILIVALELFFCLGQFKLGLKGIGLAWLIAGWAGCILSLLALKTSDLGSCVNLSLIIKPQISSSWLLRLMKVGLPACLQDLAWVAGNFVLFLIFARTINPAACEAAWTIGLRVEDVLASLPVYALSLGVGTIVGQNLGAKRCERANQAGWGAAAIALAFGVLVGSIMFVFADFIARSMSTDKAVIEYSTQYLQILGVSAPFMAVWLALLGAMEGAGYTLWPTVATATCLLVLRLPLAWYLTVHLALGPLGTWLSIAITYALACMFLLYLFKRGSWKSQQI